MREIRFRAWLKEVKEIVPVHAIDFDDEFGWNVKYSSNMYAPFSEVELMQYTGLKDKNGVEIYEGDIVRGSYDSAYEVRYMADRDYPAFDTVPDVGSDSNSLSFLIAEEGVEVIGNIHKNPELLEAA